MVLSCFWPHQKYILPHVRHELTLVNNVKVKLTFKMLKFVTDTIDYLGHYTRLRRRKTASRTPDLINESNPLSSFRKRSFFHRFCNVFCCFVTSFARLSTQRNKRQQKSKPTNVQSLIEKDLTALNELKKSLILYPVLALPYSGGHVPLDTDI